ncbi:2-hexaprenyl-6-methoxy-1,4-benzoquinone methyltransferase [Gnomoniopsis smithogilvyi]|uniref:2-methoxy-6-polyprenyl-1,4-benzoquinol methylase, mitochondrial n=1 Tax=Gnomoniopsis smithogilvyi TaxID=1191159 RepID=A0A9W9CY21_9PEZI|nr:2-hexaprenyl-6-methoxy-1,4-benzoquinone methyltransferase [Gnomoniopsis smithogilvyi]
MAAPRHILRTGGRCIRSAPHLRCAREAIRPFTTTNAAREATTTGGGNATTNDGHQRRADRETHFGFQTVTEAEKTQRVAGVFSSVAETYDRMNDLMSFGWHRVWKDHYVSTLNPGFHAPSSTSPPPAQHILDIAGGTGDIAFRHLSHAHNLNGNPNVRVTISDINPDMLAVGKQRSLALPASQQAALSFLEANAEDLRTAGVPDNSVDLYTVAFGIRNFSNIPLALREAHRVLKPGGVIAVLEFAKVDRFPLFNAVYKRWSFGAIPLIGQLVAGDRDSYQYLVESIERFPTQEEFRDMIVDAGFVVGGQGYEDLTGGVAAIWKGMKPVAK